MTTAEILGHARNRAAHAQLPYAGALLPEEAWQLMQHAGARLVDVRTRAELEWVGRVPGSVEIEWNAWPGGVVNAEFLAQLAAHIPNDAITLFMCRSGARSHQPATAAAVAG